MTPGRTVAVALLCAAFGITTPASAEPPSVLTVFGAGTLAGPFKQIATAFQKTYPDVTVQAQFGGSVMMARKITDLHQHADVLAVADYSVIPKYLFAADGRPAAATWYAGFARNAITFVYTDKSRFAAEVSPQNWVDVLTRPGVQIGRSNPDTDPSGYQTLQMLALGETHYKSPDLRAKVLANAPTANIRDTETELLAALQVGQIDYLAIYRSDALQHHMKFFDLPREIDLSEPTLAARYAEVTVHTKNGDLQGKPIVYAITIPADAENPASAQSFVAFLLSRSGQDIMAANGFTTVYPAYAVNIEQMPGPLRSLVAPWPAN